MEQSVAVHATGLLAAVRAASPSYFGKIFFSEVHKPRRPEGGEEACRMDGRASSLRHCMSTTEATHNRRVGE
jgi:hypothetical protein